MESLFASSVNKTYVPSMSGSKLTYTTVKVPATFPTNRRPVYVRPVTDVTRSQKDAAYPALSTALSQILHTYKDTNVLVHTVSYELNNYLHQSLRRSGLNVVSYDGADTRQRAIRTFRGRDTPMALLAPSLERGVDLPGDTCRCIVVCKCPFPSLGDKQVSQRLYKTGRSGRLWYAVETIRSIVQMTGRGMRSEDDQCDSYILDAQFVSNIYMKNKHLIPAWWRESLVF